MIPYKLYLIPQFIHENQVDQIPMATQEIVKSLKHFFVEHEKSARVFLKRINPAIDFSQCHFSVLDEHSSTIDARNLLDAAKADVGIISESGSPCIADPGANVVFYAHQLNWTVVPLVGPSSILLALMASGLAGQSFAFVGYLPKDRNERIRRIKLLEERSAKENQTQIFMETPYHNQSLFDELLKTCAPDTFISIAVELTSPEQFIKTLRVKDWVKEKIDVHKRLALFSIQRRL